MKDLLRRAATNVLDGVVVDGKELHAYWVKGDAEGWLYTHRDGQPPHGEGLLPASMWTPKRPGVWLLVGLADEWIASRPDRAHREMRRRKWKPATPACY